MMQNPHLIIKKVSDLFESRVSFYPIGQGSVSLLDKGGTHIANLNFSSEDIYDRLHYDLENYFLTLRYTIRNIALRSTKLKTILELEYRLNDSLLFSKKPSIFIENEVREAYFSNNLLSERLQGQEENSNTTSINAKTVKEADFVVSICQIMRFRLEQFKASLSFLKEETIYLSYNKVFLKFEDDKNLNEVDGRETEADKRLIEFCERLIYEIKAIRGEPYDLFLFLRNKIPQQIVFIWLKPATHFSFLFYELQNVPRQVLNFFEGQNPWSEYILPHFKWMKKEKDGQIIDFNSTSVINRSFSETPKSCRYLETLINETLRKKKKQISD